MIGSESHGSTLSTPIYVPPAPDELMNRLSAFEKFLHFKMLPPRMHIAMCHYLIEASRQFYMEIFSQISKGKREGCSTGSLHILEEPAENAEGVGDYVKG